MDYKLLQMNLTVLQINDLGTLKEMEKKKANLSYFIKY